MFAITCNAQKIKYTERDIAIIDSLAKKAFEKCITKNQIQSIEKIDRSLFEGSKLIAIPTCKIHNEQYWVIDTSHVPYLSLIMKDESCIGVVSSDDCNNSYIDVNYCYKKNLGGCSNVGHMVNIITNTKDSLIFSLRGTDDKILFMYNQDEIKYVDIVADYIENEEVYNSVSFDIRMVSFKSLDQISNCGLPTREKKKNSKKNLRHPLESILYD